MNPLRRALHALNTYYRADIYRRLLPYLGAYKLPMVIVIVLTLLQSALDVLGPWPMKVLVDSGLGGKPLAPPFSRFAPAPGAHGSFTIVALAVAAGVGLWLVGNLVTLAGNYLKTYVNEGMVLRFKADLFAHLQRLSLSYHDQTTVGDSMYRLNNDTGFISVLLWGNFRHLITALTTLTAILVIVVQLDWQLALLAVATSPILYGSVGFYGRHFKERSKRVKAMESMAQTIIQEVLSCLRVVKAFGQEEREQRRYENQVWSTFRARLRLSLQQDVFASTMSFVTRLDRSLILLLGGFHVLQGHLTLGELLVILSYVDQVHGPIASIGETLTDMQLSLASAERTLDVLDTQPDIRDQPGARRLDRVTGSVSFEGVSFAYRGGDQPARPVLHDITFTARPGEVVAIVGPTGAGKTTLANLLARFHDPAAGRILLDGYDLRTLTLRTLRDNIALVTQEPILFTGSVGENIAYGRPAASREMVEAAAQAAGIHDVITRLPGGYTAPIGERGARLSGGERQRLAIARAFLKDAPVLILDEPTSSLDARTEQILLDALDRLMVGRTTFIIAHRLSTIRHADQILVLDQGRIVERGTHDELLRQDGLYAQFYRIQSGGLRRSRAVVPA